MCWCLCLCVQERDDLAGNTDPSKGPVFRPPKDYQEGYQEAFVKGAKNSKQRTQYDTGKVNLVCTIHTRHSARQTLGSTGLLR